MTPHVSLPSVRGLDPAALKAVRNSLPGKLLGRTAAILAAFAMVLGFAELANSRLAHLGLVFSPAWLVLTLLVGVPVVVIATQLFNEFRAARNQRAAINLAIKPGAVPDSYFRIGPYLDTDKDCDSFTRADKAHEKALAWLRHSAFVPLYLTGDSGSGKSSLLNAFVLPALRKDGWTVIPVRTSQDAEAALSAMLTPPRRVRAGTIRELIEAAVRRYDRQLLLVLDQFEEFIILGTPQKQLAFAATLADLAERPVNGLKIILVLRSDYQTALEEIGLPRLLQGQNFFQVGRFREEAARVFLKGSKLGLESEPLDRLLKSAAELDDTPGMVRPITLNVLGFVLLQRGGAVASSLDAGTLVQDYIAQTVENPAIRAWAPSVMEQLLTGQGTKRTRQERELAATSRLRPAEVRAVLHALAEAGLARPLDATEGAWELSHDFVARAVGRYLGRRRGDVWRCAGAYAAPALLTLAVMAGLAAIEWIRLAPNQTRAELVDLGIATEPMGAGFSARPTSSFKSANLTNAVPLLNRLLIINSICHTRRSWTWTR
jgi:NACHT domain